MAALSPGGRSPGAQQSAVCECPDSLLRSLAPSPSQSTGLGHESPRCTASLCPARKAAASSCYEASFPTGGAATRPWAAPRAPGLRPRRGQAASAGGRSPGRFLHRLSFSGNGTSQETVNVPRVSWWHSSVPGRRRAELRATSIWTSCFLSRARSSPGQARGQEEPLPSGPRGRAKDKHL